MTIQSYKLGPGTLSFGAGPKVASAQVTNCRLVPTENKSETTSDSVKVLSGETLDGETTSDRNVTWKLEGTVLQDLGAASLTKYTFDNSGVLVPFSFIPSTAEGDEFEGDVYMVPLQIGGDVDARNTADFSLDLDGAPTPTWA